MATRSTAFISIVALLVVGTPCSWAGPGDIDPTFGNGGRLDYLDNFRNDITLLLPDDRIVIAFGARVARFDANGEIDPGFGDGGETRVPLPAEWPNFQPYFVRATPDGGLLFAGTLRDAEWTALTLEAALRLDRDGHLVTSFGGHGDGLYRLTDAPIRQSDVWMNALMAIAVDGSGRILLAQISFTTDGRCGGPTRVVRLTPGGMPDPAFGTNGRADAPGVDLCGGAAVFGARKDGSIVIGAGGAIVGLDASGTLDPAFGDNGHVSLGLPDVWRRGVLLADGGVLILDRSGSTSASDAVLTKLDRSGKLDSNFGAGTGSVQLDFGAAFFGIPGSRQSVRDFVLAPDAAHIYLHLSVLHPDDTTACVGGIARVALDGTPDLGFGRQGLTCLDYGTFPFAVLGAQRNGSLLFGEGNLHRLLIDATPSPGMLTFVQNGTLYVGEGDGTATVAVVRTAGHDGAVSVDFATGGWLTDDGDGRPTEAEATPGSDFLAASGQLDWADGDESEREITVTILDDDSYELIDRFGIYLSNAQGGALAEYQAVGLGIISDDEPTPSPNPTPTSVSGSGGGGSLSWSTLLVLSGLWLARRWVRTGVLASQARVFIFPAFAPHAGEPLAALSKEYRLALACRGADASSEGEDGPRPIGP